MRRPAAIALALFACLVLLPAVPAGAAFGLRDQDVSFGQQDGSPATRAGSHPFEMTTTIAVNTEVDPKLGEIPQDSVKDLRVELPEGFVGDPFAVSRCSAADFLTDVPGSPETKRYTTCPNASAVGVALTTIGYTGPGSIDSAVYNLVPSPGEVAKLGFVTLGGVRITIDVRLADEPPHNVVASVTNVSQIAFFYRSVLKLWGNPASSVHDPIRGSCVDVSDATEGVVVSRGDCPVGTDEKPFLTLPRSCAGPLETIFQAASWQNPGAWAPPVAAETTGTTGCGLLGFSPRMAARPTALAGESPSGLDFSLEVEDKGLTDVAGIAQSDIQRVVTTFPEGVTVNPSAAEGMGACAPSGYAEETAGSGPGQGCPGSSKIGSVRVETPLLGGQHLEGSLFLAQQDDPATLVPGAENPFDAMLAAYLVLSNPELGIVVKQAGEIELDPVTGQIASTFDGVPQLPFSRLELRLREGPRAPLVTPQACGSFTSKAVMTPWANPAVATTASSTFAIVSGIGGKPCPSGSRPFSPTFTAGTANNAAGAYSPFSVRVTRGDGEEDVIRFSSLLPPGLVGKIAGIPKCGDAAIEAARAKTGRAELAAPSCPASSQVGRTLAGAGVGSALTYVPGKLYFTGPFAGAPFSVVAITPAVAGPIDAGTVVVREGLKVDRRTAEVNVDGAFSDPIPRILEGIPLRLRDLRIHVDRDAFILNPTSCDASSVRATLYGTSLTAQRSSRFQAASCLSLGFKPKLSLSLKGKTRRSGNPALRAVVEARPGDANIGEASVTLPHSAFLDQAHIRTICTRVQYAADRCPQGSVYGRARAITPLLDEPLKGPVYLRSSDNELPDLVASLRGVVDIDVVGRIDSKNGGIRTTFETVPDAPVTKVVLEMQGGKKGLIENSRNLCRHSARATAVFTGHSGRLHEFRPLVKPDCGKGKKPKPRR